jgi:HEPN domain-containing protein
MLTVFARPFIFLGEEIREMRAMLISQEGKPLPPEDINDLQTHLSAVLDVCDKLDLPVSKELIIDAKKDLPKTEREFDVLTKALYAEIRNKLLVVVPPHRRKYFSVRAFVSEGVQKSFSGAYAELRQAGQCFAVGLNTAAVFHAMRAVEIGMRALANKLNVSFPFPTQLAEWANLIDNIEAKIREMKQRPKGSEKDEDLRFYSEAGMQFRYFKDGWRVRVAHTRETYDEGQAKTAIDHAVSFFETLAPRLKEPV